MQGNLNMIDIQSDGKQKLISSLSRGKMIGERGLIRNQPRSLSAIAKNYLILLSLDGEVFKSLMVANISAEILEKLKFLDKYVPDLKAYSGNIKEKIAFTFEFVKMHKREILIEEGTFGEYLYYILEGECMLSKGVPPNKINILTVGVGCSIADECVFLGRRAEFTVSVVGESAKLYRSRRPDLLPVIPDEVMRKLVLLSKIKYFGRKNVLSNSKKPPKFSIPRKNAKLPLASLVAQKSISNIINRNTNGELDSSSKSRKLSNKRKLEQIRDLSLDHYIRNLSTKRPGHLTDRVVYNEDHSHNKSNMA